MSSPWPSGRPAFPYSLTGKIKYFPYKFHWKNSRPVKFVTITLALWWFPCVMMIHKQVHSPANVAQWDEIRKKREHTHFDPPRLPH